MLAPLALAALFAGPIWLIGLVVVFVGVGAWEWARMCRDRASWWLAAGWLVLAVAGGAVVWISYSWPTPPLVLWLFGVVWGTDIGAYVVGTLVRGPRIAPAISPNKTWAGLAGGMALAAAWSMAWGAYFFANQPDLAGLGTAGAATAIVAQVGDFAVSLAKRHFGVKDSSGLIPGHGGVLDRVAGLLTTGPALALLMLFGTTTTMTETIRVTVH